MPYNDRALSFGKGPIAITPRELEAKLIENHTIRPFLQENRMQPDNSKQPVLDEALMRDPHNAYRFISQERHGGPEYIVVTDVKTINPESQGGTTKTKPDMPETWERQVLAAIGRMPDSNPDKAKLQQAFGDSNIVLRTGTVDYRPDATVGRENAPVMVVAESPVKR